MVPGGGATRCPGGIGPRDTRPGVAIPPPTGPGNRGDRFPNVTPGAVRTLTQPPNKPGTGDPAGNTPAPLPGDRGGMFGRVADRQTTTEKVRAMQCRGVRKGTRSKAPAPPPEGGKRHPGQGAGGGKGCMDTGKDTPKGGRVPGYSPTPERGNLLQTLPVVAGIE